MDLFFGASMPISVALAELGCCRIEPIDLIHGQDILDDAPFEDLLLLSHSGLEGAGLATPSCSKHTRAPLRPHGPTPVQRPEFVDGLPSSSVTQQLAVQETATLHHRARLLLSAIDAHSGLAVLENLSSSVTWGNRLMYKWVQLVAPFAAQACACRSAADQPHIVQQLVDDQVAAGFIEPIPGGIPQLEASYQKIGVGKLGLVLAEGRSPRLVVDNSISNMTCNTTLPNHLPLPRIPDVMCCAPESTAQQNMLQLTLYVSKAHRRILIAPADGALLCFYAGGVLYRCITLNFGAPARGWYWGRVAASWCVSTPC
eukprot:s1489_g7.t1